MKLFGKDLFNFRKEQSPMYDFAQHGITAPSMDLRNELNMVAVAVSTPEEADHAKKLLKKKKKKQEEVAKLQLTPKGVFACKALNDNKFYIKSDVKYLTEQINLIKQKLDVIGTEPEKKQEWHEFGGVRYGRLELQSLMERLQSRLKLKDTFSEPGAWQLTFTKYPHTTNELISKVLAQNTNLSCKTAKDFVPDFPKEAIDAMREYDEMCVAVCGRKSVYYVIAQGRDFEKKNRRRDPILLAQSPFGFFWQILGAWDEEMVLLDEL